MTLKLALHTWTLLGTPLADIAMIARSTGWDGLEVSRLSIAPNHPTAVSEAEALTATRALL